MGVCPGSRVLKGGVARGSSVWPGSRVLKGGVAGVLDGSVARAWGSERGCGQGF